MAEVEAWRVEQLAEHGNKPGYPEAIEARYQHYRAMLMSRAKAPSTTIRNANPPPTNRPSGSQTIAKFGGGGDGDGFGGGGASGSWGEAPASSPSSVEIAPVQRPDETTERVVSQSVQYAQGRLPVSEAENWRKVERNGYLYEIDEEDRTRRVSGEITVNPHQGRAPKVQREAGGGDRRDGTDEGGHYIARRFDGPLDAFNHFAQDRNFNRSGYRRLEEEWARAKRAGKVVWVKIVPVFESPSKRPSRINVWFWIDGERKSKKFPNEPKE